jgi:hypothetical protein
VGGTHAFSLANKIVLKSKKNSIVFFVAEMASRKFVAMMKDIRGLVKEDDLDFVRNHAEPLSPGDFIPASPEMSAAKFGGRVPPRAANVLTTVLGAFGVVLAVCVVGVVVYKINRASKNN